jgi:hypothetical protein
VETEVSKIDDLMKGNVPIYTVLGVVLSGGGLNVLSEGNEAVEHAAVIEKIEAADYIQDVKYDSLLALVNELRIEIAGMKP